MGPGLPLGLGRDAVVYWIHAADGGSLNLSDLAINVGVLRAVIAMLTTQEKTGSTKAIRDSPAIDCSRRGCAGCGRGLSRGAGRPHERRRIRSVT